MSGHSKWSTIKRQKGAADAKRGQLFTKLSSAITIAAKQGAPDPVGNFKLRIAVDKARAANMPKDSIERAIEKAVGRDAEDVSELTYEGFGPGGVSIIVETVTNNKQRTFSEVKNIFDKNGGNLGGQGSVMYQFNRVGEITAKKAGKSMDDLFEIALNAGAEDVEDGGEVAYFYTGANSLFDVKKVMEEAGLIIESAELTFKPVTTTAVEADVEQRIFSLIEKLEDLDDVQKVSSNLA